MSNFVEILFAFDWAGAITILNANPELASQRTKNNDLPIHLVLGTFSYYYHVIVYKC